MIPVMWEQRPIKPSLDNPSQLLSTAIPMLEGLYHFFPDSVCLDALAPASHILALCMPTETTLVVLRQRSTFSKPRQVESRTRIIFIQLKSAITDNREASYWPSVAICTMGGSFALS
jgi:hypothetical protein